MVIIGARYINSKWGGKCATETLSNKTRWTVSSLVCGRHEHVFEHRAKLGPQIIEWERKRQRMRETQLLIHLFIYTYYSGHAVPGTNRRADECKHTSVHMNTLTHRHTHRHRRLFFIFCHSPCLSNVVSARRIKIRSANTHMPENRC